MTEIARGRRELRQAVGRALRGVREKGAFSLDDLARASRQEGVSVSRSHLSRVENGEADLSLPRFLVLMRVLGEPRDVVLDDLEASLVGGGVPFDALIERARCARRRHEHERVAEASAAALALGAEALVEDDLAAWLRAEAHLGRWRAAARVAQLRLSRRRVADEGVALLEACVVLLASGQERAALAFSRAAKPHRAELAEVAEGGTLVALGRPEEALARVDGASRGAPQRVDQALALLVATSAYLALDRPRAALHAAQSAVEMTLPSVASAEARLALARAEGAQRRPRAGLRLIGKLLPVSRENRLVELTARAQRVASALHRQLGNANDARLALRAARALARRIGADRGDVPPLPLQAMLLAASQPESSSPSTTATSESSSTR